MATYPEAIQDLIDAGVIQLPNLPAQPPPLLPTSPGFLGKQAHRTALQNVVTVNNQQIQMLTLQKNTLTEQKTNVAGQANQLSEQQRKAITKVLNTAIKRREDQLERLTDDNTAIEAQIALIV